jgi:ubiquinone/menaquinone biosynthesis C-methylase UbiE
MLRRRILLTLFDLLYTRLAWSYDMVNWLVSGGLWYRWTEQALPFVGGGPVLEVGCGRGRLLDLLARQGQSVTGVDRSLQMARYAARQSGQPVVRADGRALPFPDHHFAVLITTFPAPYILEPQTQREFARVVQPGGLWLWLDAPTLHPDAHTLPARLLTRLAWGNNDTLDTKLPTMMADRSAGLWQVELRHIAVGPSTVTLRLARRAQS